MAGSIVKKAKELGFEKCGIVAVEEMEGFAEKLNERIAMFPETEKPLKGLFSYAKVKEKFPWAKAVVVCSKHYGKYKIPQHLKGHIAKKYLTDTRRDAASKEHQESLAFEEFLNNELGLQTATNRDFGITALRWAAAKAGVGKVRRNNFFYGEHGSYYFLEAYLIDKPLEHIYHDEYKECPENCNRCINSCPSKSLAQPYAMNRSTCVSCLTSWEGWDMRNEKHNKDIGEWIFGCDVCQDVCPFNSNKWLDQEEFPGLTLLAQNISFEKILAMDYTYLREVMSPKFWYIGKKDVWKWKTNVLNAMLNNYEDRYEQSIIAACADEDEHVRQMASWVLEQLKNEEKLKKQA